MHCHSPRAHSGSLLAFRGPVIDLDGTFDYIHDNLRPRTPESLKAAILYCLGEKELTRGPRLVLDMLNDILGGEVIEVPDDGTGQ